MAETVRKHVPNPAGKGGFQKGNKLGPGRGHKKARELVGEKILADMDRAYSTPEQPDDPPIIKSLRALAHDEPVKFLTEYAKLCGRNPGTGGEAAAAATEVGEREAGIEELAERLLSEWEAEDMAEEAARRAAKAWNGPTEG